jgi:hypothetical protein
LQGSYALLVTPDGGELVELPKLPAASNGVHRSAKLTLSPAGTLSGEVVDLRYGDYASFQRSAQRGMTKKEDQIKPIETMLSSSVGTYQITKASIGNLDLRDRPFQYTYSFVVPRLCQTRRGSAAGSPARAWRKIQRHPRKEGAARVSRRI